MFMLRHYSALLAAYTVHTCRAGCLDNVVFVHSVLGFTCQVVRCFPTFAPCLEDVCAGGGGGSVAIVGLVLVYLMGL